MRGEVDGSEGLLCRRQEAFRTAKEHTAHFVADRDSNPHHHAFVDATSETGPRSAGLRIEK